MQQGFAVPRHIGVDDEGEVRQVQPARGDIGGNADPRPAVAQRLQRLGPLGLRQLARQRHDGKAPIGEPPHHPVHRHARVAEHDGVLRVVEAQHVDDGVFAVDAGDAERLVVDVEMLFGFRGRIHPDCVALVAFRHAEDGLGHGGREHQRAALFGCCVENRFQLLAKAHLEHLVRFVEHDHGEVRQVQHAPAQVIAQPSRRADHDMRPALECHAFHLGIHAADAAHRLGARVLVEPVEFALHLHGEFAGRRDAEHFRRVGAKESVALAQQGRGCREAERHRLARPRLRGNQQVLVLERRVQHGVLHRREGRVALFAQGGGERGMRAGDIGHGSLLERAGVGAVSVGEAERLDRKGAALGRLVRAA